METRSDWYVSSLTFQRLSVKPEEIQNVCDGVDVDVDVEGGYEGFDFFVETREANRDEFGNADKLVLLVVGERGLGDL